MRTVSYLTAVFSALILYMLTMISQGKSKIPAKSSRNLSANPLVKEINSTGQLYGSG